MKLHIYAPKATAKRAADVERCLRQQGIRVFRGRDGVWTTVDLVNAAGGMSPAANEPYSADVLGEA